MDVEEEPKLGIWVFLPLILLDGRLYSYDHEGGLKEEKEVQLIARYYTRKYFESTLINVVRKERFKDFLKSLGEDFEKARRRLGTHRREYGRAGEVIN